ncbi:MAG TPA: NAD(+)/NADH kinase, partial [Anaerolineaceae bacterium]|nr:NAD(+)/NADH kinase [Anaerolineaceae bacterium]
VYNYRMYSPPTPPQRICVVLNPKMPETRIEGEEIARCIEELGLQVHLYSAVEDPQLAHCVSTQRTDALIVLGGDGTMLRAGHLTAPYGIPVIGINLGRFGFLMEMRPGEWRERLPLLVQGKYWIEQRMMLHAAHWRGEQCLGEWDVLNEVVVCRGMAVRPLRLTAVVDDEWQAVYIADGLIASAATGSTAYALAAGGPILPPELRNILVVPVAPHLSVDRAIVLPEGAQVAMSAHTSHDAIFSVDGQKPIPLLEGDWVRVGVGPYSAHFIRFQDPGYFYRNLTKYMEKNPAAGGEL